MLGERPIYFVLVAILTVVLTVFMLGCSPEEEIVDDEEDEKDKNDIEKYQVDVQADPEDAGEIKVSGDGTYEEGETVILNTDPETGMGFAGWKDEAGEIVSTDENYYFEIKEDKALTAQFTERLEVTLKTSDDEKGNIDAEVILGEGTFEEGEEKDTLKVEPSEDDIKVSINAEPETGVEFEGWKNEDGEIISASKYYEFELEEDKQLVAQFQNLKEDVAITEKHDDINWSTDEVLELSKEAFSVYFDRVRPNEFTSDAKEKLNQGLLKIHYPGIKDYDIEIKEVIKDKDEVNVEALIHYPHVDNETFDELKGEIRDEVLAEINKDSVNLREVFSSVLERTDLSEKSTVKTLAIEEKHIEEKDNDDVLRVVDIDEPDTLFDSFHQLYEQAIAQHVQEVEVEINQDEENEGHYKKSAQAKIFDKEVEIMPAIDPRYLLNETTLVLSEELEISLEQAWSQLTENVDYNPYLDLSPEAYFHNIDLRDTNREGKQPIRFTRPYMVATMDSVIGYIDTETKEINLFTKISSGDVSDFYWAQTGEHISYHFKQSGSGFGFLHVYDVVEDEVIAVTEFDEFKEKYGLDLDDHGGFVGEFKNITWSEDGETLYFDTKVVEEVDHEGAQKATSWAFDVKENALTLKKN